MHYGMYSRLGKTYCTSEKQVRPRSIGGGIYAMPQFNQILQGLHCLRGGKRGFRQPRIREDDLFVSFLGGPGASRHPRGLL